MLKIGDFVYSTKYHHYGLIINYNNELKVFREDMVKGQSVFKPCNIRDEELYLKFDKKSFEKYKILKMNYNTFLVQNGGYNNGVFSLNNNIIEYKYSNEEFIYNTLQNSKCKLLNELKPLHSYWCLNTKFKVLNLFYFYGKGMVLSSNLYYKLSIDDIMRMSIEQNTAFKEKGFVEEKAKVKFIKSHPFVTKQLSGYWIGHIDACSFLAFIDSPYSKKSKVDIDNAEKLIYYVDNITNSVGLLNYLDAPCTIQDYKFYDFGLIKNITLESEYWEYDCVGKESDYYLFTDSHCNIKVQF